MHGYGSVSSNQKLKSMLDAIFLGRTYTPVPMETVLLDTTSAPPVVRLVSRFV